MKLSRSVTIAVRIAAAGVSVAALAAPAAQAAPSAGPRRAAAVPRLASAYRPADAGRSAARPVPPASRPGPAGPGPASPGPASPGSLPGWRLQQALNRLVLMPSGPPAVIVIVRRPGFRAVYRAGTASLADPLPPSGGDHVRLASVSKAFSGAVALSLVAQGKLALGDTIGQVLPRFPAAWRAVTLADLLWHRSGLPDYSASPALLRRVLRAPRRPIAPMALLRYVWNQPLRYRPGTRYRYDNSDNVVAAMMARAVTHRGYRFLLRTLVFGPAGLRQSSLPSGFAMPRPYLHGYLLAAGQPAADVSEALTASIAWASGGIVATPDDLSRFVRDYLAGRFFPRRIQAAQFHFVSGQSEPPGPGLNSAGLAIFRYQTRCGTVYGHTGNFLGYTQFAAASRSGADSVTVTATEQLSPRVHPAVFAALRAAESLAICAAVTPGG
jgi:D-alanyl-D-alanine carboxypeptidase